MEKKYGRNNKSKSYGGGRNRSYRGGRGRSGGGYRGGRGGRGRGGRRGPTQANFTHDMFIKKAKPVVIEDYTPTHKFKDFDLEDKLKNNIISKGYEVPTPIQDKAIPECLQGKDVIGIANTGTGKTAAFLIPMINKVLNDSSQKVLIMVPTRELANQVEDEYRAFAKHLRIFSVRVIGGASMNAQIKMLSRPHNFVIGTPGRIKDLAERGKLKLNQFQNVILDEVDRMVDMGFIKDMQDILGQVQDNRQSLFFSATLPKKVELLTHQFLKNPVRISVKTEVTSDNVHQNIVKVTNGENKLDKLHDLLTQDLFEKTIVFVKTKRGADRLDRDLYKRGFKVASIHGDKSQGRRQRAINDFKESRVTVLVATDVAARGLDIPDVTHVINYDLPNNYEDYTHRIGRTGRASKVGHALTFVN